MSMFVLRAVRVINVKVMYGILLIIINVAYTPRI